MEAVPDLIAKRATLSPDSTAMADLASGDCVTYRMLNDASVRAAWMLAEAGVKAQDRVAILCRNRIEFFETLFACVKLGALLVPLNWRMPAQELESILDDCTPLMALAGAEDRDRLAGAECEIIDLDDHGVHGYRARCATAEESRLRDFWPGGEPWYLLYTSGTTGKPKAVIQTAQMALVNYLNIRQAIDLRRDDVTLNFLPLFHTAGVNLYTLPFLFAGGEVKILPGFDVEKTMALLEAGALNAFFGVPAVYQEIARHPNFATADLSKVRSWGCGGAPLPDILVERFAERGALVCNGYGMTETGPTAFLMNAADVRRKIGSVGKPQLLTAARIVTADGASAAPGETGEIQLKGPGITPGYWNAPQATKEAFTEDGWLKTGDLAMTDEDGFAYIVGRSKEMYISGGENVYPAEVENVYARHPAVVEVAIVGVPDPKWGEVGCAYVLLRAGATADAEELTRFGRERLAAYKAPKRFVFVDDFPRTAAGKVQKHLLARNGEEVAGSRFQVAEEVGGCRSHVVEGKPPPATCNLQPPSNSNLQPCFTSEDGDNIVLERALTQDDFNAFAALSGDDNPIHVDPDFSARTSFGRTVAHGMLLYTVLRGLAARLVPNARQLSQELKFPAPAYAGERLRFEARATGDNETARTVGMRVTRVEDGECVCEGACMFAPDGSS